MDLSAVTAALGAVVLERIGDGLFVRRCEAPTWWYSRISDPGNRPIELVDVFPFLEVFVPAAEEVWSSMGRPPLASEMWTETDPTGQEFHLEAFATRAGEAAVLVIARNEQAFHERQLLLQRARELRLTYDALMREIEREDILLHTIVHDLTAPLHSIVGALSLLAECDLPEGATRWTQLATQAAARQRELIQGILSVFVSEQNAANDASEVDLSNVIARAVSEREPVARQRQVELVATIHDTATVLAEQTRLVRVLTNLLDNAIRHSPVCGQVRITSMADRGSLRVEVEDDGGGVSSEMIPRLFQKLAHDPRGGGTGLGLYFCRITIEQWGGGIGYEPRTPHGAKFWIRLQKVTKQHQQTTRTDDHGEAPAARRRA